MINKINQTTLNFLLIITLIIIILLITELTNILIKKNRKQIIKTIKKNNLHQRIKQIKNKIDNIYNNLNPHPKFKTKQTFKTKKDFKLILIITSLSSLLIIITLHNILLLNKIKIIQNASQTSFYTLKPQIIIIPTLYYCFLTFSLLFTIFIKSQNKHFIKKIKDFIIFSFYFIEYEILISYIKLKKFNKNTLKFFLKN